MCEKTLTAASCERRERDKALYTTVVDIFYIIISFFSYKILCICSEQVFVQVLSESVSAQRQPDQAPANAHGRTAVQMQLLRAVVQHIVQSTATRAEHTQQRKAVQVSTVRTVLRTADQPGQTLKKTRGRRSDHHGRSSVLVDGRRRPQARRSGTRSRRRWRRRRRRMLFRGDPIVHGQSERRRQPIRGGGRHGGGRRCGDRGQPRSWTPFGRRIPGRPETVDRGPVWGVPSRLYG